MNLEELRNENTRINFIKIMLRKGFCPNKFELQPSYNCDEAKIEDCRKCWERAIKDIKFKNEEETMKAICIDDNCEKYRDYKGDQKIEKMKGITKDKEYEVNQSEKYEGYYEVMNDLGKIETYKKYRFEVVEGEKMQEKKIIKVKCINAIGCDWLEVGEEYDALEKEDCYLIVFGNVANECSKDRFKKVTDDILMVECIDNQQGLNGLIVGRTYKVIREDNKQYKVLNECDEEVWCNKSRFKPVPKEKEKKEYTIQELFKEKEGVKFKIEGIDYIYFVLSGLLRRDIDGTTAETIYLNKAIVEAKFTKVEEPKPVSTVEAFKALDEGKIIQSILTSNRYKKDGNELVCNLPISDKYEDTLYIEYREIEGQWLIIE